MNESGLPPVLQERIEDFLRGPGGPLNPASSSGLPLLTALSYESTGGEKLAVAARLATTMAFMLTAADVLDDLQDGDIAAEDASSASELIFGLMLLGHRSLASTPTFGANKSRVADVLQTLDDLWLSALAGQHLEIAYSSRSKVSTEQALNVTTTKSGSLGRCAATIGALFATEDQDMVELHGDYGARIGTVAQLINDADGVRPNGGKSTDLTMNRKTLPVAYVLEVPEGVSSAADWARNAIAQRADEPGEMSPSEEATLREALYDSGAVHYSWISAASHHAEAVTIFEQIRSRYPASRLDLLL